ncbi:hypothetical protein CLOP_g4888 [Closterium sp. NIES-67]|nr:hypothetical protein CLOP_g4888 [Closterium sp. NIES-67]
MAAMIPSPTRVAYKQPLSSSRVPPSSSRLPLLPIVLLLALSIVLLARWPILEGHVAGESGINAVDSILVDRSWTSNEDEGGNQSVGTRGGEGKGGVEKAEDGGTTEGRARGARDSQGGDVEQAREEGDAEEEEGEEEEEGKGTRKGRGDGVTSKRATSGGDVSSEGRRQETREERGSQTTDRGKKRSEEAAKKEAKDGRRRRKKESELERSNTESNEQEEKIFEAPQKESKLESSNAESNEEKENQREDKRKRQRRCRALGVPCSSHMSKKARVKQALETVTVPINGRILSPLDSPAIQELLKPRESGRRSWWETRWLPVSRQEYFDPNGRYLFVTGHRDFCAGIRHFHRSLSCRIAEAAVLNRTLVLDMGLCINGLHNEGKYQVNPIHVYYDLKSLSAVRFTPLQGFLEEAAKWQAGLGRRDGGGDGGKVEDAGGAAEGGGASGEAEGRGASGGGEEEGSLRFPVRVVQGRVRTRRLVGDDDTALIIRAVNYGFSACEFSPFHSKPRHEKDYPIGSNHSAILHRPELLALAGEISQAINGGDYDAVHVRRGDKLNPKLWPHLDRDTRPPALLKKLPQFVAPGRTLYIATNEQTPGFFNPLRTLYKLYRLEDFLGLWQPGTTWFDTYAEIMGVSEPVFDPYMEVVVDYRVLNSARTVVRTFPNLTSDPEDGHLRLPPEPSGTGFLGWFWGLFGYRSEDDR